MKKWMFLFGLKMAAFFVLAVLALGSVVMMLWNWLIPAVFSGPEITFFQALGILVLAKILTGGFKGRWGGSCGCCGHHGGKGVYWRMKMQGKWEGMSEEEKEKFRKHFSDRCHKWGWHKEDQNPSEQQ